MTKDIRRSDEEQPRGESYTDMIRSLPRLRDHGADEVPEYAAPTPTLVRVGASAQGCTGLLLTLAAIPMILVALWSGYYLWGPGLFLVGGMLLVAASVGIWRGALVSLVVAVVVLIGLAIVAVQWMSFIPAVAALFPLGQWGLLFDPVVRILAFLLFATLILHVIGLFYWRRLHFRSTRAPLIWGVIIVVLAGAVFAASVMQINDVRADLEDRADTWLAGTEADALTLGANSEVTLGTSFLTAEEDTNPRLDVRLAELEALADSGVPLIRVKASGDMWLERDDPRLFGTNEAEGDDEDAPGLTEEERAEAITRVERQQGYEAQYVEALQATGANIYLADSFVSQYMLVYANQEEALTWDQFAAFHLDRVTRYAEELQPMAYEVISEPSIYTQFSGLSEPEEDAEDERLDQWVAHTEDLIAAVNEVSPDTLIGVSLLLDDDFDAAYYQRVMELDGLDFIGVRVLQIANFEQVSDALEEMGHPADYGKDLLIVETWYGYCLAPQRSMDVDSAWLDATVAYAAEEGASAVLVRDMGCFLQEGGTLFADEVESDNRTAVFDRWQELVGTWNIPLDEALDAIPVGEMDAGDAGASPPDAGESAPDASDSGTAPDEEAATPAEDAGAGGS